MSAASFVTVRLCASLRQSVSCMCPLLSLNAVQLCLSQSAPRVFARPLLTVQQRVCLCHLVCIPLASSITTKRCVCLCQSARCVHCILKLNLNLLQLCDLQVQQSAGMGRRDCGFVLEGSDRREGCACLWNFPTTSHFYSPFLTLQQTGARTLPV